MTLLRRLLIRLSLVAVAVPALIWSLWPGTHDVADRTGVLSSVAGRYTAAAERAFQSRAHDRDRDCERLRTVRGDFLGREVEVYAVPPLSIWVLRNVGDGESPHPPDLESLPSFSGGIGFCADGIVSDFEFLSIDLTGPRAERAFAEVGLRESHLNPKVVFATTERYGRIIYLADPPLGSGSLAEAQLVRLREKEIARAKRYSLDRWLEGRRHLELQCFETASKLAHCSAALRIDGATTWASGFRVDRLPQEGPLDAELVDLISAMTELTERMVEFVGDPRDR